MKLIKRLKHLCQADLHGFLDKIEDPETTTRQAIREMEEVLHTSQRNLEEKLEKLNRLKRNIEERKLAATELQEKMEVAFSSKDEKLARHFVRKKLENNKTIESLEESQKLLSLDLNKLESSIAGMTEDIESIKRKLEIFTETGEVPEGSRKDRNSVSEEELEVAFYQERSKFTNQTVSKEA